MNIVDKRKATRFYELKVGDVFKCGEVTAICVADANNKGNIGINLATGTKLSLTNSARVEILNTTLTIEDDKKEKPIQIDEDIKDVTLGEIASYCFHATSIKECSNCPISKYCEDGIYAEDLFQNLYYHIQENK